MSKVEDEGVVGLDKTRYDGENEINGRSCWLQDEIP